MTAHNTVEIREVLTKSDLRKFVDYPNKLYRDVPQFIPAFYGDDLADWDHSANPAFQYCEARCFLAYRDGEIVGRIGAILSHKSNETWNTKRMRFSQVDFIDDAEVVDALFATVEQWAAEKGCDEVHGPLGFCDLDREGMLVEGFDRRSMFITYYNHPYYIDHLTRLGYVKDTDWIEHLITVPGPDSDTARKLHRLSERILKSGKYRRLEITKKSQIDAKLIARVFSLINAAYAPLYGVVELNEQQIDKYAKKFVPLVNPKLLTLVEDAEGNLVAFAVCAPSMADAIKKSNGRLFPTGWVGVLKSLNKNDTADMLLTGIHPDHQGIGVNAVLMSDMLDGYHKMGITHTETGPTLETNNKILAQWKVADKVEQHKRRRCFVKKIG